MKWIRAIVHKMAINYGLGEKLQGKLLFGLQFVPFHKKTKT